MVKNLAAMQETGFNHWDGKIPQRMEWQPTPAFLPGEFHRQRSLARLSPWGPKESDTTDHARSHWASASAIPLACDGLLPSCPAVSFTSYPGFSLFLPPGCLP